MPPTFRARTVFKARTWRALLCLALPLILPALPAPRADAQGGELASYAPAAGSHVLAITDKAGLLGALGHRHAVLGRQLEGSVCYSPARAAATRGRIAVATDSLVIDSEEGRALADLGEGPGAEDVEEIQSTLLSAEYLAADSHPEIRFDLERVRVGREGPMQLQGHLTLRGVTQEVTVPASVERGDGGSVVVDGSFTVQQSDFGMEPASVAGVVKVADAVEVRFHLVLEPGGKPCGDGGSGD